MSSIVELSGVNKVFHTEEIETHALNDISFVIEKGEYVSISGPSGCGKSTLLSILGLLDSPSGGKYVINGFDVSALNTRRMAEIRNQEIGFVFQSFNLISDLVSLTETTRKVCKRRITTSITDIGQ
jgi:putative ABC transport system ATP-binding protein